jgi:apoptosis-inducing factor 3
LYGIEPCVEVTEGKKLVVIGSSFISMELVVAVTQRKPASIHVIGQENAPFELVLGKEVGKALQKVSHQLIHIEMSY